MKQVQAQAPRPPREVECDRRNKFHLISIYSIIRSMIQILGVSVVIYFLYLFVLGLLLFVYSAHGLVEGFQAGSRSPSGTYAAGSNVYVKDCTGKPPSAPGSSGSKRPTVGSATTGSITQCVSLDYDTDRITYLQRLPVGGSLISSNGRYTFKYRADGMLIIYDTSTRTILWSSDTKGSTTDVPGYLINLGAIQARSNYDTIMKWVPVPASSSGSGSIARPSTSGSGSSAPTYSIPLSGATNTTNYLLMTDYGDLVILNSAGSKLWRSNTGDPPVVSKECVPVPMEYPFTQEDCYDLKNSIEANMKVANATDDVSLSSIVAQTAPDTYMPLYAYLFGDYVYADSAPWPVALIKTIEGVNIFIAEQGGYLKMVADDALGTAKSYDITAVTPWNGVGTSWQDTYWTSGLSQGGRADGNYMLYLAGKTIQSTANTTSQPAFVNNEQGRMISMYGDWVLNPTTQKWPVAAMKTVEGLNIYVTETFSRVSTDTPGIKMVADDAVGTAKYIIKTGTMSIASWNDSYWTTGTSAGKRVDGHYMIDKNDVISSGGSGSGNGAAATIEAAAAKTAICNLEPYYKDKTADNPSGLGCAAYLAANPTPTSKWAKKAKSVPAVVLPSVAITASIENLSNQAVTTGGDITQWIRVDDLVYFGYITDVQGPYVVASITPTTITFNKRYIGPKLTASVISVVSSKPFSAARNYSNVPLMSLPDNEVYSVGNGYTKDDAQAKCGSYGATLATMAQLTQALDAGADWCMPGWLLDKPTLHYPVTRSLQTGCGDGFPGIKSKTLTTGAATCYGVKPANTTNTTILPFSQQEWTMPISGSVYAGTSYITTVNTILPDNIGIGDLVYIEAPCNVYDTDLGDGTCRAYDCNPGEVDAQGNNQCQTYNCRAPIGNQKQHIKNANGTCTVPIEYSPCPKTISSSMNSGSFIDESRDFNTAKGDTVTESPDGNICTYNVGVDTTATTQILRQSAGIAKAPSDKNAQSTWGPIGAERGAPPSEQYYGHSLTSQTALPTDNAWVGIAAQFGITQAQDALTYSVKQAIVAPSFNYDVIKAGLPSSLVTKSTTNPSYIYPKAIGPYIISFNAALNNIMVKSYTAGDLDTNRKFLGISSKTPAGTPIKNRVPELRGRQNIRIYKATYDSTYTDGEGSSGSKLSLTKKVVGCAIGTYGDSCTPCAPGNTTPAIAASTCSVCTAGYYCKGGSPAVQCAAGQMSSVGAASCTNCVPGTSSSAASATCAQCMAGYYCSGGTAQVACPAGQSSAAGASACTNCPAGQSSSSTGPCLPCPAGYSSVSGGSCTPCAAGLSSRPGELCSSCAAGQSSTEGGLCSPCPAGQSSTAGGLCRPCPGGQSSTSGGLCINCLKDQFSASGGPCQNCPAGQASAAGSASCSSCPSGQSSSPGGPCSTCPAGYYCPPGAPATMCAAGTYSSAGSPSCSPCLAGKTSTAGASSCSPCPAGYACTGGAARTECKLGTYALEGASVCSFCPAGSISVGTYNSSMGVTQYVSCSNCPAGYYCPGNGVTAAQCPAGSYSGPNAASCTQCPANMYSMGIGNAQCNNCPAGKTSVAGSSSCTPCPAGQTSTSGGACTSCPAGTVSSAGGQCTVCGGGPGSFCPPGSASPIPCRAPAGYYCPGGAAQFTACPPGFVCAGGITPPFGGCPPGYIDSGMFCQAPSFFICPFPNSTLNGDRCCMPLWGCIIPAIRMTGNFILKRPLY